VNEVYKCFVLERFIYLILHKFMYEKELHI